MSRGGIDLRPKRPNGLELDDHADMASLVNDGDIGTTPPNQAAFMVGNHDNDDDDDNNNVTDTNSDDTENQKLLHGSSDKAVSLQTSNQRLSGSEVTSGSSLNLTHVGDFPQTDVQEAHISRSRLSSGRSERRVRIEGYQEEETEDEAERERWNKRDDEQKLVSQTQNGHDSVFHEDALEISEQTAVTFARIYHGQPETVDWREKSVAERLFPASTSTHRHRPVSRGDTGDVHEKREKGKKWHELTKGQLVHKYQLHMFVALIFLVTVLSVSLAWHFRFLAMEMLSNSQRIFFDPRSRQITLTGHGGSKSISGHVGLDMPRWQLPLHCPLVMGDTREAKECVWKNNAVLRIVHFTSDERLAAAASVYGTGEGVSCYNVSWESFHPQHAPHDCFDMGGDDWFGPSNQSESTYPIRGQFSYDPSNYILENNGVFDTVADFYWLSSHGVALRVNPDDPVQVFWNQTGDNKLCIRSNYTGPFYHQMNRVTAPHLNYTLCTGSDARTTHSFMMTMMAPQGLPYPPAPETIFQGSHWSTSALLDSIALNQSHVVDLAERLSQSGFESNSLVLDGDWQAVHGDLTFDTHRFPNVTEMLDIVTSLGGQIILRVSPFFEFSSLNFKQGIADDRFVLDTGGHVIGLVDSEFGLAAVADVSVADCRRWLSSKVQNLTFAADYVLEGNQHKTADTSQVGVAGLRLSFGRKGWLPFKPRFRSGDLETPNNFRRHMTETFSQLATSFIVDHTSDSRHVASLIPVQASVSMRNGQRCLAGLVETALTLGIMGYPFIMADGIGADADKISSELYMRWLEAATIFPSLQHSLPPWQVKDADDSLVAMAANVTRENEALRMKVLQDPEVRDEVTKGMPILRPLWMAESFSHEDHEEIKDQFLLGINVLVAPVLCEGVTSRDVFLPGGVWQDYHHPSKYLLGPTTVRQHKTPLGRLAVFKQVMDTGVNKN